MKQKTVITILEQLARVCANIADEMRSEAPAQGAPAAPPVQGAPAAPPVQEVPAQGAPAAPPVQETPVPLVQETPAQGAPATPPTVDADGTPWDKRIHSGGMSVTQDGRWKRKRGVDPEEIVRITAEIKNELALQETPPSPPVQDAPPSPPVQDAPAAPPVQETPSITTFAELSGLVVSKGLTSEQLDPVLARHGIAFFPLLAEREDLIPAIAAELL